MALYDREDRQFLCVPKPSKVKIGILLEDNRTQADHSSNSDVNFSVNNQATTVRISLSLSEFSFVYEVHLYTPKKPQNQYNWQLQWRTQIREERLRK